MGDMVAARRQCSSKDAIEIVVVYGSGRPDCSRVQE